MISWRDIGIQAATAAIAVTSLSGCSENSGSASDPMEVVEQRFERCSGPIWVRKVFVERGFEDQADMDPPSYSAKASGNAFSPAIGNERAQIGMSVGCYTRSANQAHNDAELKSSSCSDIRARAPKSLVMMECKTGRVFGKNYAAWSYNVGGTEQRVATIFIDKNTTVGFSMTTPYHANPEQIAGFYALVTSYGPPKKAAQ